MAQINLRIDKTSYISLPVKAIMTINKTRGCTKKAQCLSLVQPLTLSK